MTTALAGMGALFRHCHGDKKIILECTTHYMYQQTAIDVLSSQEAASTDSVSCCEIRRNASFHHTNTRGTIWATSTET